MTKKMILYKETLIKKRNFIKMKKNNKKLLFVVLIGGASYYFFVYLPNRKKKAIQEIKLIFQNNPTITTDILDANL